MFQKNCFALLSAVFFFFFVFLNQTSAQSQLSASPTSINLGRVYVGSGTQQQIKLTNSGKLGVTIALISVSGNYFSVSGATTPINLAASASVTITAHFAPSGAGAQTGKIVVEARNVATLSVPLSGTAVAVTSPLTASPTALNFGDVTVGKSSSLPLKLTNYGNSAITISNSEIAGSGFSVSGGLLGLTLQAGESDTVEVIFNPASTGSASGMITLVIGSTATSVSLSGIGASSTSHAVSLTWAASSSSDLTGYMVERATTSGGPYQVLNSSPVSGTSYVDSTVQNGKEYFYVVVAVSKNGEEGGPSEQVSATIPSS